MKPSRLQHAADFLLMGLISRVFWLCQSVAELMNRALGDAHDEEAGDEGVAAK